MKKYMGLMLLALLLLLWEHRSETMYPVVRKQTDLCGDDEQQGVIPSER